MRSIVNPKLRSELLERAKPFFVQLVRQIFEEDSALLRLVADHYDVACVVAMEDVGGGQTHSWWVVVASAGRMGRRR